jgi:hypothetical protein
VCWRDRPQPFYSPDRRATEARCRRSALPANGSGEDTLAGLSEIGHDTQSFKNGTPQFNTPNHQYDTSDFDQLVAAINAHRLPAAALPGVSFLKAPGFEDGHGAYSDPADEQQFVTREIDALMHTPDWSSTAVLINYDDSDGWYDHQFAGVQNPSQSPADNLTNTTFSGPTSGLCQSDKGDRTSLAGQQARCGFGPRLPMILVSPFARSNSVDHNLSDQASIINLRLRPGPDAKRAGLWPAPSADRAPPNCIRAPGLTCCAWWAKHSRPTLDRVGSGLRFRLSIGLRFEDLAPAHPCPRSWRERAAQRASVKLIAQLSSERGRDGKDALHG